MRRCLTLFLLSFIVSVALADEDSGLRLNGFYTLGMLATDDDNIQYRRDLRQPASSESPNFRNDSRVGIQGRYRFSPEWELTGQVISQYRYDESYTPELTWAYGSYHPSADSTLRVGRLGFDVFSRSDSRDIGFTYLWARPVNEFWGLVSFSHYEGVDYSHRLLFEGGVLKLKAFMGSSSDKFPSLSGPRDFNHSPLHGVVAEYSSVDWQFQFNYAQVKVKSTLDELSPLLATLRSSGQPQALALADEIDLYNTRIRYYGLAAAHNYGPWRWQFGINYMDSTGLSFPSNTAGIVSLGYRLNDWIPYAFISAIDSEKASRSSGLGSTVDNSVQQAITRGYSDQRTVGVGARFDVAENTAVKVQVEYLRSDEPDSLLLRSTDDDWDQDAMLFSLTLDQVF